MTINSIADIVDEFKLSSTIPSQCITELKKIQISIHPDNFGGEFPSSEIEEKYHRLSEAIDFLNEFTQSSALAPYELVTEIVKILEKNNNVQKDITVSEKLSDRVDNRIRKIGKISIIPKISSASIPVLMSTIWMFPNIVEDHPILSKHINIQSPNFIGLWVSSIILAIMIWYVSKFNEDRLKYHNLQLITEDYQNTLFEDFKTNIINYKNPHRIEDDTNNSFTKSELIKFIVRYPLKKKYPKIQPDIAQSIADIIIKRAIDCGMIVEMKNFQSLIQKYSFT